jgi:hypothetical protein
MDQHLYYQSPPPLEYLDQLSNYQFIKMTLFHGVSFLDTQNTSRNVTPDALTVKQILCSL